MKRMLTRRVLLPAAALTVVLAQANPAAAAGNDDFEVWTQYDGHGFAGTVKFIDYGPGAPGGGNNDDYLEIYDNRPDGHGVQVWAWLHGKYLDTRYHGAGSTTNPVYFDPYAIFPKNVAAGERIGLKICLVDGINNLIEETCNTMEWQSIDG